MNYVFFKRFLKVFILLLTLNTSKSFGGFDFLCQNNVIVGSVKPGNTEINLVELMGFDSYFKFQQKYSSSFLFKDGFLSQLIKKSENFKKAIILTLLNYGHSAFSFDEANIDLIVNHFMSLIFNNGDDALKGHIVENIDVFFKKVSFRSIKKSYLDLKPLAGEFNEFAKAVDLELSDLWNSKKQNPVYDWCNPQSAIPDNLIITLGREPKRIHTANFDANFLSTLITSNRKSYDSVDHYAGKMLSDQFLLFVIGSIPKLKKLESLLDKCWEVAEKSNPFSEYDNEHVKDILSLEKYDPRKDVLAKSVVEELMSSAEFYENAQEFTEEYVKYINSVAAFFDAEKTNYKTIEEFRVFYSEKLLTMIQDLDKMGLNFQTISPRYKELARKLGRANFELGKYLITK